MKRFEMTAEKDLETLLASMQPDLRPGVFAFMTVPEGMALPAGLAPVMVFHEKEGTTLIVDRHAALEEGHDVVFPSRMITLAIHSSLDAVGFLAAVTARLAAAGMPVNPVAGYHHDHLFVPEDRAEEALILLKALAEEVA